MARTFGYSDIEKTLLAANAKPSETKGNGVVQVLFAASENRLDVLNALIDGNVDVNASSIGGSKSTALCFAASKGHLDIVNALIAAGADVNKARWNGDTPLDIARRGGHREVEAALTAVGATTKSALAAVAGEKP